MNLGIFLICSQLFAGSSFFTGYPKKDPGAADEFTEIIIKVEPSPGAFQIAFSGHAPFYSFPRAANERMVERFLREAEQRRTKLKVEFNPYTSEIYRISSER